VRRTTDPLEASVRAFRELTAAPADGAATRARVLARAAHRIDGRQAWRRRLSLLAVVAIAAIVASSVVAAALTVAMRSWHAPAAAVVVAEATPAGRLRGPVRVIPAVAPAMSPPDPEPTASEEQTYGRAHRLHFVDGAPARALAAWNEYLAAYPRGTFAPEARYNRALCLVRLSRHAEATRALHRFADAPPGSYRRQEAVALLEWMARRNAAATR
jgi:hypothetical protein